MNRLTDLLKMSEDGNGASPIQIPFELEQLEERFRRAYENYTRHLYGGRITLFTASRLPPEWKHDPQLGWGELAKYGVEIHNVPGWHTLSFEELGVRVLAEKLQRRLSIAQQKP